MSLDLAGPVPIFPLPEMVFFPGTVLPLHLFEPRYREMAADLLDGDRLLAMALLDDGWQEDYFGNPPIHPIVTVGRVRRCERLEDGRFNIELVGLARARVLEEVHGRSYRLGRLQALEEVEVAPEVASGLRDRLLRSLRALVGEDEEEDPPTVLLDPAVTLSALCDRLASLMPLETLQKQGLLAERDPAARCRLLMAFLEALRGRVVVRRPDRGLPGFSAN